jgi:hypothetical protein
MYGGSRLAVRAGKRQEAAACGMQAQQLLTTLAPQQHLRGLPPGKRSPVR